VQLRAVFSNRYVVRATKSLIGSVISTVCSEVAFALCYGTSLLGTTGSSAVAFVAGAIPNYFLNRSWAWDRHGKVRVWREVVLYIVVSLVSFGASAVVTAWAGHAAHHVTHDHAVKTILVSGAYLGTYVVLFGLKFLAYEFVIFVDPDRREPDPDPSQTDPSQTDPSQTDPDPADRGATSAG
jgi:putative flippase GtrA